MSISLGYSAPAVIPVVLGRSGQFAVLSRVLCCFDLPAVETLAVDEAAISACGSSIMWRHVPASKSKGA